MITKLKAEIMMLEARLDELEYSYKWMDGCASHLREDRRKELQNQINQLKIIDR